MRFILKNEQEVTIPYSLYSLYRRMLGLKFEITIQSFIVINHSNTLEL